jgi:tetratricopeptide (TPR) repeat protein
LLSSHSSIQNAHPEAQLGSGIIAFKEGRFANALACLSEESDNPVLEAYRRLFRAKFFFADSCFPACVEEIEGFLALAAEHPIVEKHPAREEAVNLLVEASIRAPGREVSELEGMEELNSLTPKSFITLAGYHMANGRVKKAKRCFMSGLREQPEESIAATFADLVSRFEHNLDLFTKEELVSIAEFAVVTRNDSAADIALRHLAKSHPSEHAIAFLKAHRLALKGKHRKALAACKHIFESEAPVSIKKAALLKSASLEYRLKRFKKAAESYRIFGLYYPNDPRSERALDIAARIEIAGKRWTGALGFWEKIRKRRPSTSIGREAVLGEAVLRYWLGAPRYARRILEELLPDANGEIEAAILYWLHRTSTAEDERAKWLALLDSKHPRSFYSSIAREGHDTFLQMPDKGEHGEPEDDSSGIARMKSAEEDYLGSIAGIPPECRSEVHAPLHEAFTYFIWNACYEEASKCGRALISVCSGDTAAVLAVYKGARENGMYHFGFEWKSANGMAGFDGRFPLSLGYPVAYANIVRENSRTTMLPPELVLAVMREESRFSRFAVSAAGARGLMQLMPSTGQWIGEKLGNPVIDIDDLHDPEFSIEAGSWYLRYLIDRNGGSLIAGLAAYNAGNARMKKWKKTFEPAKNPLIAIEMIGLRETRRYVRRVLDCMAVYRSIAKEG